jgi:predicted NACHT family NTPase
VILIFDGLDEILDVEPRREIVTFIEQFADVYAACPVLVTSRFVGYQDAPMSDEFAIFGLTRFDTNEIETFAQRLIKQVGRLKVQEAKAKASQFIRQTDTVGQDLRENPLMLGLMVYIFMYRGDVPSNRPEIYKECATLMFEKWDQRRDIFVEIPTDFDLLDVFAYLASEIFGSAETEDGVSGEWLITTLRNFFEKWYLERPRAVKVARSLVTFITGRAWVMCEIGPKVFKFTHRTFLEYFFARYLISTSESVSDLIKSKLFDRVVYSQWDVIVHLALHAVVFRDVGKMNQAADTLLTISRSVTMPPQEELAFIRL